jgi:hypothetical protein
MKTSAKSKITGTVGNGRANRIEDVLWVKQALHDLGHYRDRHERHGYIDRELHDAICGYQRDRGLKCDGWLRPDGEIERTMRVQLAYLDKEDDR